MRLNAAFALWSFLCASKISPSSQILIFSFKFEPSSATTSFFRINLTLKPAFSLKTSKTSKTELVEMRLSAYFSVAMTQNGIKSTSGLKSAKISSKTRAHRAFMSSSLCFAMKFAKPLP